MPINWYPGHMVKAKRQFSEKLNLVDIVFELRDARVPASSQNPDIDGVIKDKPRVIVLMKSDLADAQVVKDWLQYYQKKNQWILAINANDNNEWKKIHKMAKRALEETFAKMEGKGLQQRAIRAIVVGVPNVGKSTLINRIAGRKAAKAENKPGVTQQQQWVKWNNQLELLDTPGILWPKFEDEVIGYRLALTGAIPDRILHMDDIALYGMQEMVTHYPGALTDRYKLPNELEEELSLPDLLMEITRKRGFRDDYEQGSITIVNEFRKGLMGPMSLDRVEESLWH